MQLFQHHLTNFEGSNRKPTDAKEHVRRVCRLLYEVDPQSRCVSLLWNDRSMDVIRNQFFLGNDATKKPRAPQTLKTYVVSFKLFFKFMLARKLSVRRIATVTQKDLEEIDSALKRLSSWPSSYKVASQKKKVANRKKDMNERLDSKSFKKLRENEFAEQIKKTFELIKSDANKVVDIQTFANCRDFLLCMLMLGSGQRCGAAANLTMEEFNNGEWATVEGEYLYITQTVVHKTQSDGPAKLFWDKGLKSLADIYIEKMRPVFQNNESMLPERPGVPAAPALFIAVSGKYLTESRISNRLAVMGKKLNPEMPGTLKGSCIRKGIISTQRDMGETSEISRERLASQMTHAPTTADKYYNVQDTTSKDAQVAKFISKVTGKVGETPPNPCSSLEELVPHELEPAAKKELLRVYSKTLAAGHLPSLDEISNTIKRNKSLKGIEVVAAYNYVRRKAAEPLTPAVKTATWVGTGARKIASFQATSVTGSGDGGRKFTMLETEIIQNATKTLPANATIRDIMGALHNNAQCAQEKIFDKYTRQQLRDKFRNIAKKRK